MSRGVQPVARCGVLAAMREVEQQLTRVLGGWAAASVALGAALSVSPRTRGFGRQSAAWGAVDGAIAYAGARNRAAKGPTDPARLRRVLLVNAGSTSATSRPGPGCCNVRAGAATAGPYCCRGPSCLLVLDTAAAKKLSTR